MQDMPHFQSVHGGSCDVCIVVTYKSHDDSTCFSYDKVETKQWFTLYDNAMWNGFAFMTDQ